MGLEDLTATCEKISVIVNEWNSHDQHLNFGMPNWQAQEAILDGLTNMKKKISELSKRLLEEIPKDHIPGNGSLVKKYLGVEIRPELSMVEKDALVWTAMRRMDDIICTQEMALKNFGKVKE